MKTVVEQLLDRQDLSQSEAEAIMLRIMSGEFNDVQIAGFLVALRSKGETAAEIAGFARAMRSKMTPVPVAAPAIDLCGTGGDASGTFNISTAASIIAAGAGVKVAKHGNRSMTSQSGSADVLASLGVNIAMEPEKVAECVDQIGLGFMFAPALHPAMKYAVGARKALALRTVFNVLGPLCNPAAVKRQVMGVFDQQLTDLLVEVLRLLGAERAFVVHGEGGLDEITITGFTSVKSLEQNGNIHEETWTPEDFGLERVPLQALKGGTPEVNATIIRDILKGKRGPCREIACLNAAAGIVVGGAAETIQDGLKRAEEAVDSGSALAVLEQLVQVG